MDKPIVADISCEHFDGYKPCEFLQSGERVDCRDCPEFVEKGRSVLLIKLGARGDVLRTTPLLRYLVNDDARVFWLTDFPEFVPKSLVAKVLTPCVRDLEFVKGMVWDKVINLDKDVWVCGLMNSLQAKEKRGFVLDGFGQPIPLVGSVDKFLTGVNTKCSKENKSHFVEEIFDMCGDTDWKGEGYILEGNFQEASLIDGKFVVGVQVGTGGAWGARCPSVDWFVDLVKGLDAAGFKVRLLGGMAESGVCEEIVSRVWPGGLWEPTLELEDHFRRVASCHLVVTPVTMTLHVAIALKRRIVCLNNIFNKNEFYLYGLGQILEPEGCKCYYASRCERFGEGACWKNLKIEKVVGAVREEVDKIGKGDRKEGEEGREEEGEARGQ